MQDVRLDHRGQQIVRRADRMDVAREVEVQVLHRDNLGIAAAGRAAFDPEHRAERSLSEAEHRFLADVPEALRERNGRRRLPFAGFRRRDRGDVDQLRVRVRRAPVENGEIDLRLEASVEIDLFG